jgi:hypothetical protein
VQLGALEDGRIDLLPGRVYAIGFVRAYAEYLGLDGDKMVHLFKAQAGGHRVRPELNIPAPASESKSPGLWILGGSFAALVLLGAFLLLNHHKVARAGKNIPVLAKTQTPVAVPLMTENSPLEVAVEESLGKVAGQEGPRAMIRTDSRVVVQANDSAWVEIRDAAGKPLFSRILKKGDKYIVPNEPGILLDTGNIGAIDFYVDGKQIAPLGQNGDVKRNVKLDADALKPEAALPPVAAPGAAPAAASGQAAASAAAAAMAPVHVRNKHPRTAEPAPAPYDGGYGQFNR